MERTKKELEQKVKGLEGKIRELQEQLRSKTSEPLADAIWDLIKDRVEETAREEANAIVDDLSISR